MPIPIACPQCKNPVNAPDSAAGKTITCWKCSTAMSVPIPDADVVDEPPRRAAKVIGTKSKPRLDDDDDDDDRPVRRKPAKKTGSPVLLIALIGGGVLLLAGVAVGGYLIFGGKKAGLAGGLIGGKAPPGYSSVGDSGCGCRVFLPGNASGNYARKGQDPVNSPIDHNVYLAMSQEESLFLARRTPGFTPGTNEEQFMKTFEQTPFMFRTRKWDITNRKMITVAGKPALQFTMVERPDLWDDTPMNADFFRDKNNKEKDRVAREGKRTVVIVTANGEWSYVIGLTRKLEEPSAETIKTVLDSVTFN